MWRIKKRNKKIITVFFQIWPKIIIPFKYQIWQCCVHSHTGDLGPYKDQKREKMQVREASIFQIMSQNYFIYAIAICYFKNPKMEMLSKSDYLTAYKIYTEYLK